MASKIKNTEAKIKVENRENFIGANLHGVQQGGIYVVYSYGDYPLWVFSDGKWYGHNERFSVTTGKHRGQSAPPRVDVVFDTVDELRAMVG